MAVVESGIIFSKHKLKKSQDSASPCLNPCLVENCSDVSLPILTILVVFARVSQQSRLSLVGIPKEDIVVNNDFLSML